jgi:hypothetical protein
MENVIHIFSAMVGCATFIASLINLAKIKGLPDGIASDVSFWANFALFVVVAFCVYFGKIEALQIIDAQIGILAKILTWVGGFGIQFGLTRFMHYAIRGAPIVGYSHSM